MACRYQQISLHVALNDPNWYTNWLLGKLKFINKRFVKPFYVLNTVWLFPRKTFILTPYLLFLLLDDLILPSCVYPTLLPFLRASIRNVGSFSIEPWLNTMIGTQKSISLWNTFTNNNNNHYDIPG